MLDEDAMVIDLSSAPYGVDLDAARRMGAKLMNNVLNPLLRMRRMNPWSIRVGRRYGGDRPVERAIRRGF